MTLKEQLTILANTRDTPCVTISLNTHRSHPDNAQDVIVLKSHLKEAQDRVIADYGKKSVASLLEKIENLAGEVDVNDNSDSLHIFLSNSTKEIIRSSWDTSSEGVHISDSFSVRSIIKSFNRSESYLLLVIARNGVQLYEALNGEIVQEIINDDFPFLENNQYNASADKGSDSRKQDDMLREYLNKIDKALKKVHHETDLKCVVICTDANFTRLQQVADSPSVYSGYSAIDYNKSEPHQVVKLSWDVVKSQQEERRSKAIEEVTEAVARGTVLTDLQEIYQASVDGRGELLLVHQDFAQPVIMTGDRTFQLTDGKSGPDTIDDITSTIAWEVLSKKGKVFFVSQEEIKELGNIVLKTRY